MKKFKKIYAALSAAAMVSLPFAIYAAPDAVGVLTNLKDLMITILEAVGVILVIWGIVQVAIGFKSQDGTQKTHGILFLAGGALIASTGIVLTALGF